MGKEQKRDTNKDVTDKEYKKMRKGRVFVKNFPFDTDVNMLEKLFRKCGEVESVNFPKRKEGNNELKGYGFVQFKHKNMALKAVNSINKRKVGDRRIEVTLATAKK